MSEGMNAMPTTSDAATEAATILEARGLRKSFGALEVLKGVDLTLSRGEVVALIGPSGSGKSTLIRCLNRLVEPSAGKITLHGEDVTAFDAPRLREMRRGRMSMVFQSFGLLPHRTVLQNVEMGMAIRGDDPRMREAAARDALAKVGLKAWADHYPNTLSGGMRQRVGLARALATNTDLLLMDEPFSALDPLIRRELQDELLELQAVLKKTIIFVTHDIQEAVRIGTRIAIMRDGKTVQIGTPQDLILNPVNDYVSDFARDLDRGRVLRCCDVMRPLSLGDDPHSRPRARVQAAALLADAYRVLSDADELFVVDSEETPLGVISSRDVLGALGAALPDAGKESARQEGQYNG